MMPMVMQPYYDPRSMPPLNKEGDKIKGDKAQPMPYPSYYMPPSPYMMPHPSMVRQPSDKKMGNYPYGYPQPGQPSGDPYMCMPYPPYMGYPYMKKTEGPEKGPN